MESVFGMTPLQESMFAILFLSSIIGIAIILVIVRTILK